MTESLLIKEEPGGEDIISTADYPPDGSYSAFACKLCEDIFHTLETAKVHVEVSHLRLHQHQCKICRTMFIEKSKARIHFNRLHPKSNFEKSLATFPTAESLLLIKYVSLLAEESQKNCCKICGFIFSDKKDLVYHYNTIHHQSRHTEGIGDEEPQDIIIKVSPRPDEDPELYPEFSDLDTKVKFSDSPGQHNLMEIQDPNSGFEDLPDVSDLPEDDPEPEVIKKRVTRKFSRTRRGARNRDSAKVYAEDNDSDKDWDDSNDVAQINDYLQAIESSKDDVGESQGDWNEPQPQLLKPWSCTQCHLAFKSGIAARSHVDSQHLSLKQYQCQYCKKEYLMKKSVKIHCSNSHTELPMSFLYLDRPGALEFIREAEWNQKSRDLHCHVCKRTFKRRDNMLNHLRKQHGINSYNLPFGCKFCQSNFLTFSAAKRHVEIKHIRFRKFLCGHCNKSFLSKGGLRSHCTNIHANNFKMIIKVSEEASNHIQQTGDHLKTVPCPVCHEAFGTWLKLRVHFNKNHQQSDKELLNEAEKAFQGSVSCFQCGMSFKDGYSLRRHQSRRQPCSTVKKEVVKPLDPRIDTLFVKMDTTDPRMKGGCKFACLGCTSLFKSLGHARLHASTIHLKIYPYKCEQCSKAFSTPHHLKIHTEMKHVDPENRTLVSYQCETCGKHFYDKNTFKHHQTSHTEERNYHCEVCGKAYRRKDTLHVHKRTQHIKSEMEGVQCDICGQPIKNKLYLKKHIKLVHQKKCVLQCHICHNQFASKNVLQLHVQSVHEKIRYTCEYCGREYASKSTLKQHVDAVHLKLKPHVCSICQRAFGARVALLAHMKTIHHVEGRTRINNKFQGTLMKREGLKRPSRNEFESPSLKVNGSNSNSSHFEEFPPIS